jgi:hypothetical protein
LIDGIYRGMTGVQLLVTFKEWTAAMRSMTLAVVNEPRRARELIGQLSSDLAKQSC